MKLTDSLLDQARKMPTNDWNANIITSEIEDLAIAWLKGEVGSVAVQKVLRKSKGVAVYILLSRALRQAFNNGKIKT